MSSSLKPKAPKGHIKTVAIPNVARDQQYARAVGQQCNVGKLTGTLAFYGEVFFAPGMWCGIILNAPVGETNGSRDGIQYFTCEEGFGVFRLPDEVRLMSSRGYGWASPARRMSSSKSLFSDPGSDEGQPGNNKSTTSSRRSSTENGSPPKVAIQVMLNAPSSRSGQRSISLSPEHLERVSRKNERDMPEAPPVRRFVQVDHSELAERLKRTRDTVIVKPTTTKSPPKPTMRALDRMRKEAAAKAALGLDPSDSDSSALGDTSPSSRSRISPRAASVTTTTTTTTSRKSVKSSRSVSPDVRNGSVVRSRSSGARNGSRNDRSITNDSRDIVTVVRPRSTTPTSRSSYGHVVSKVNSHNDARGRPGSPSKERGSLNSNNNNSTFTPPTPTTPTTPSSSSAALSRSTVTRTTWSAPPASSSSRTMKTTTTTTRTTSGTTAASSSSTTSTRAATKPRVLLLSSAQPRVASTSPGPSDRNQKPQKSPPKLTMRALDRMRKEAAARAALGITDDDDAAVAAMETQQSAQKRARQPVAAAVTPRKTVAPSSPVTLTTTTTVTKTAVASKPQVLKSQTPRSRSESPAAATATTFARKTSSSTSTEPVASAARRSSSTSSQSAKQQQQQQQPAASRQISNGTSSVGDATQPRTPTTRVAATTTVDSSAVPAAAATTTAARKLSTPKTEPVVQAAALRKSSLPKQEKSALSREDLSVKSASPTPSTTVAERKSSVPKQESTQQQAARSSSGAGAKTSATSPPKTASPRSSATATTTASTTAAATSSAARTTSQATASPKASAVAAATTTKAQPEQAVASPKASNSSSCSTAVSKTATSQAVASPKSSSTTAASPPATSAKTASTATSSSKAAEPTASSSSSASVKTSSSLSRTVTRAPVEQPPALEPDLELDLGLFAVSATPEVIITPTPVVAERRLSGSSSQPFTRSSSSPVKPDGYVSPASRSNSGTPSIVAARAPSAISPDVRNRLALLTERFEVAIGELDGKTAKLYGTRPEHADPRFLRTLVGRAEAALNRMETGGVGRGNNADDDDFAFLRDNMRLSDSPVFDESPSPLNSSSRSVNAMDYETAQSASASSSSVAPAGRSSSISIVTATGAALPLPRHLASASSSQEVVTVRALSPAQGPASRRSSDAGAPSSPVPRTAGPSLSGQALPQPRRASDAAVQPAVSPAKPTQTQETKPATTTSTAVTSVTQSTANVSQKTTTTTSVTSTISQSTPAPSSASKITPQQQHQHVQQQQQGSTIATSKPAASTASASANSSSNRPGHSAATVSKASVSTSSAVSPSTTTTTAPAAAPVKASVTPASTPSTPAKSTPATPAAPVPPTPVAAPVAAPAPSTPSSAAKEGNASRRVSIPAFLAAATAPAFPDKYKAAMAASPAQPGPTAQATATSASASQATATPSKFTNSAAPVAGAATSSRPQGGPSTPSQQPTPTPVSAPPSSTTTTATKSTGGSSSPVKKVQIPDFLQKADEQAAAAPRPSVAASPATAGSRQSIAQTAPQQPQQPQRTPAMKTPEQPPHSQQQQQQQQQQKQQAPPPQQQPTPPSPAAGPKKVAIPSFLQQHEQTAVVRPVQPAVTPVKAAATSSGSGNQRRTSASSQPSPQPQSSSSRRVSFSEVHEERFIDDVGILSEEPEDQSPMSPAATRGSPGKLTIPAMFESATASPSSQQCSRERSGSLGSASPASAARGALAANQNMNGNVSNSETYTRSRSVGGRDSLQSSSVASPTKAALGRPGPLNLSLGDDVSAPQMSMQVPASEASGSPMRKEAWSPGKLAIPTLFEGASGSSSSSSMNNNNSNNNSSEQFSRGTMSPAASRHSSASSVTPLSPAAAQVSPTPTQSVSFAQDRRLSTGKVVVPSLFEAAAPPPGNPLSRSGSFTEANRSKSAERPRAQTNDSTATLSNPPAGRSRSALESLRGIADRLTSLEVMTRSPVASRTASGLVSPGPVLSNSAPASAGRSVSAGVSTVTSPTVGFADEESMMMGKSYAAPTNYIEAFDQDLVPTFNRLMTLSKVLSPVLKRQCEAIRKALDVMMFVMKEAPNRARPNAESLSMSDPFADLFKDIERAQKEAAGSKTEAQSAAVAKVANVLAWVYFAGSPCSWMSNLIFSAVSISEASVSSKAWQVEFKNFVFGLLNYVKNWWPNGLPWRPASRGAGYRR